MSRLPGYENTVICPYNKCHVILKHRIQTHLIKCAKQHPEIQLETCPFDVTHKFRAEDRDAHIEECPSRENFDRYVYSVSTNNASNANNANNATDSQPRAPAQQPRDIDDWED